MRKKIHGITKDILVELYLINKKSLSEIGKIFNCHGVTILNYLKEFNIPRRNYSESLIGRKITWGNKIAESNKGKIIPTEQRQRISKTRIDKGIKPWNTGLTKAENPELNFQDNSGEKHWNWKGGISRESCRIRQTSEYKLWRKRCFIRDNYQCQKCGDRTEAGHRVYLNVHHKKPFAELLKNKEELFDVTNGITLCKKCHKISHDQKLH